MFKPQVHYLEAGPSQQDVTGYVHHISADEAQENPEVVIGMFPVNNIPAVILFDSGASHSFYFSEFCCPKQISLFAFGQEYAGTNPGISNQKQYSLPQFGSQYQRSLFSNFFDTY